MKKDKSLKSVQKDVNVLKVDTLENLKSTPSKIVNKKNHAKAKTPLSSTQNNKAMKNSSNSVKGKRNKSKTIKHQRDVEVESKDANDSKRQKLDKKVSDKSAKQDSKLTETNNATSSTKKKKSGDDKVMKFLHTLKTTKSAKADISKNATFSSLSELGVSDLTLNAIEDMSFKHMMEVQAQVIPHLLRGEDLLVSAKTGSGRTVAFLVPAIEILCKHNFKPKDGTGIIIISPNRELAMQIYGVAQAVLQYHSFTFGLLIGGIKKATELEKLDRGLNIIVATPGKLLDHLLNSKQFVVKNLKCLVIDEADLVLGEQFEAQMKQIIKLLPEHRQTMLFSGSQTGEREFAKVSVKKMPKYIGIDDSKDAATVEGLVQNYVICPTDKRFLFLANFLRHHRGDKIMVFLSSCNSVRYHGELLKAVDIPVLCTFSKQHQRKRMDTFFKFYHAKKGILICTDVAARGWDVPHLNWIVQYDPPTDPKEYIQRVGGTARGVNGTGCALLILQPHEIGFVDFLRVNRVPIEEIDFPWFKTINSLTDLNCIKEKNSLVKRMAVDAFKAYFRSYDKYELKSIFQVARLEVAKIALSFGFVEPPSLPEKIRKVIS